MPPKFARIPDRGDRSGAHALERTSLLDGESDDEDFFLRGPQIKTDKLGSDPKVNRLQNQVGEVIDVMKDNVSKVIERGDRLDDLQDKSDSLASNSDMFRHRAKSLSRNMWWKNCRMKIIIALVILAIVAIIIIPIIVQHSKTKSP